MPRNWPPTGSRRRRLRQLWGEFPGHAEGFGDRLHRAEPDHVGRVLHRVIARDPDSSDDRVAHHPKNVRDLRVAVGRGQRLKAGRRKRDDQVVFAADELASDHIRRRGVSFGIEAAKPDGIAVCETGGGEARDDPFAPSS